MTRIVDAHNDLLIELAFRAHEDAPFAQHYLGQLREGRVAVQVCAMTALPGYLPEQALRTVVQQAGAFMRAVRENPHDVVSLTTAADLARVDAEGRLGLLLAMEGVEALGSDPGLFEFFWDLGVRMVGLTWVRRNVFADGEGEDPAGGLSMLGRELVDLMAERGAILDLAHANEGTFRELLARAPDATVVLSHGGCRALCDTPRMTSDEQLRALAERDGVIGIVAVPSMLSGAADTALERMVDHIDHVVRLVGIEHVGIGSDFMRQLYRSGAIPDQILGVHPGRSSALMDVAFDGLAGPAGLPALAELLGRRGYDVAAIDAVLFGNWMRVLRRALPGAASR